MVSKDVKQVKEVRKPGTFTQNSSFHFSTQPAAY